MKKRLFAALLLSLVTLPASAGFNDPWYLVYRVSGGSLNLTKGPYSSRMECVGDRFSLPIGSTFVGCYQ